MIACTLPPGMEEQLMALGTKEEIMREYGMLAYVPGEIADRVMCGVWALRRVRGVGLENLGSLELDKRGFFEREDCLRYACRAGVDFSIIRSLYESLSGLEIMTYSRQSATEDGMRCAARGGLLEIVEAFIETLGVDVDAVHPLDCKTALMFAAENGHTDIVNALAGTHNANVEAVDNEGWTALMWAARNGHTDTVNVLAGTHNANVEAVSQYGRTVLMCAAVRGRTDIVNVLAGTHNANVEAVDQNGSTALLLAAEWGHTDTVNALAGRHKANVEAVDGHGMTALMRAARNGHIDTVEALRALGASSEW